MSIATAPISCIHGWKANAPMPALRNWYLDRVLKATDAIPGSRLFFEIIHLLRKPSALFRPDLLIRVLLAGGNVTVEWQAFAAAISKTSRHRIAAAIAAGNFVYRRGMKLMIS